MLTLFTTPVVYLYLDRVQLWWAELPLALFKGAGSQSTHG
jgi:hypothetical protein